MSLTFVGDPAQSIYGWRNAKTDLFLNYAKLFPGLVKEHTILKNYRTPKQLVELANNFRKVFVENGIEYTPSEPHLPAMENVLNLWEFNTPEEEINTILRDIKRLHAEGVPYSKMSILCRRNEDLAMFESGVVSMGIPYYFKFDSQSILQRSAFKFLYSLYSLILDGRNTLALAEIVSPLKGIGDKFIADMRKVVLPGQECIPALLGFAATKTSAQWKNVARYFQNVIYPVMDYFKKGLPITSLNRNLLQNLNNCCLFADDIKFEKDKLPIAIQRKQLIEVFNCLSNLYSVSQEDGNFRDLSTTEQFRTIYENIQLSQEEFVDSATDEEGNKIKKEDRDALGFYTVHSYKGKENDYIYYAMVDGLWSINYPDFEPRCVFYVAITRPRKRLVISKSFHVKGYDGTYKKSFANPFVNKLVQIIEEMKASPE